MKKFLIPVAICLVLTACTATSKTKEGMTPETYGVLKGDKADPVHGEETALYYGAMSGLGDTKANGVAYIRTYKDGASVITVNLNIPPAPQGKTYRAKLENDESTRSVFIGDLRSLTGDVRHAVSLDTKADIAGLRTVSIYLGDDIVADGEMRAPGSND